MESLPRPPAVLAKPNLTLLEAGALLHVEGLIWTSNQCDPDDVLVLFGDRVAEADLEIAAVRDGGSDASFLEDVRVAGERAGIRITV